MKTLLSVVLLCVLSVGCGKKQESTASGTTLATQAILVGNGSSQDSAQWARDLRKKAIEKHVRWMVICSERDGVEFFIAAAHSVNEPENAPSIEEGALPHWNETGPTQESAAKKLMKALDGDPDTFPHHKGTSSKSLQCEKVVSGGYSWGDNYKDSTVHMEEQ